MLKESLPHMRAAGKGQVIITTSLVGFSAFPFTDAYSASKFALEGGTLSLAHQLVSLTACSWGPGCHHVSSNARPCFSVRLAIHCCQLCSCWQGCMAGLSCSRGFLCLSCCKRTLPDVLLAFHVARQECAMQPASRLHVRLIGCRSGRSYGATAEQVWDQHVSGRAGPSVNPFHGEH